MKTLKTGTVRRARGRNNLKLNTGTMLLSDRENNTELAAPCGL
jgi:hypothetical protein